MNIWITALFASGIWTALAGAVIWIARSWFTKRLAVSIEHRYNAKLENIKAELRSEEQRTKSQLDSHEAQLGAMRDIALSRVSNRHAALDQRRLLATEQLWDAVGKLVPFKMASRMMKTINFDEAAKAAPHDETVRQFFETIWKTVNLDKIQPANAHMAQPFVSKGAWAAYEAYASIGGMAAIQLITLKTGAKFPKPMNEAGIRGLVAVALPHQLQLIDKFGIGAVHYLMDELEGRILEEIDKMLRSDHESAEDLQKAKSIIAKAAEMNSAMLQAEIKTASAGAA